MTEAILRDGVGLGAVFQYETGHQTAATDASHAAMTELQALKPCQQVTAFVAHLGGEAAIAQITCPVLFLLGAQDQMAHPKGAQGLIKAAKANGHRVSVVNVPVGHHQMTEAPEETLMAIHGFLRGTP